MSVTAKSVIFDISDNWGDPNYLGIRSIDFWYNDSKISLAYTDFSAYETTKYSDNYFSKFAFDTSLSKTGALTDVSWVSNTSSIANQRLIIVFNTTQTFDEIRVNNSHGSSSLGGTETDRGAKNVVINISTDTITNTVYDASISNSIKIFDGQFDQHIASDVEDEQTLELINRDIYCEKSEIEVSGKTATIVYQIFDLSLAEIEIIGHESIVWNSSIPYIYPDPAEITVTGLECSVNMLSWSQTDTSGNFDLSDEFHKATKNNATGNTRIRVTVAHNSGKRYYEIKYGTDAYVDHIGLGLITVPISSTDDSYPGEWFFYGYAGNTYAKKHLIGESLTSVKSLSGADFNTGDIMMIAVDFDSGKSWVGKNGTWLDSGNPETGENPWHTDISGTVYPYYSPYQTSSSAYIYGLGECTYEPPVDYVCWDSIYETIVDCDTANITISGKIAIVTGAVVCSIAASIVLSAHQFRFNRLVWGTTPEFCSQLDCGDGVLPTFDFTDDNSIVSPNICGAYNGCKATKSKASGKWYFEVKFIADTGGLQDGEIQGMVGLWNTNSIGGGSMVPGILHTWGYNPSSGSKLHNGLYSSPTGNEPYGPEHSGDLVVGCAVDLDAKKIWWSVNNDWLEDGDPLNGLNPAYDDVDIEVHPAITPGGGSYIEDLKELCGNYYNLTYDPPETFYPWGYEAPLTETLILCKPSDMDFSVYKSVITLSPATNEDLILIQTHSSNVRVLNFRATVEA